MRFGISALVHEINKAIEICKINDFINHIEIGIDNLYECKAVLNYIEEFKSNDISIGIHLPMELNTCENIEYIRNSWVKYIEEVKEKLNPLDIKYFNIHLGYVIKTRFDKNKNKYLDKNKGQHLLAFVFGVRSNKQKLQTLFCSIYRWFHQPLDLRYLLDMDHVYPSATRLVLSIFDS